tara:strand:+ start:220 stop:522 length:303 start_codon:yes stop_codon:yes gene_type:complete
MKQITLSILTLLALYVLYSECIKIPSLIKKNKTIFYLLIIGFYLYYSNNVEGMNNNKEIFLNVMIGIISFLIGVIIGESIEYVPPSLRWHGRWWPFGFRS